MSFLPLPAGTPCMIGIFKPASLPQAIIHQDSTEEEAQAARFSEAECYGKMFWIETERVLEGSDQTGALDVEHKFSLIEPEVYQDTVGDVQMNLPRKAFYFDVIARDAYFISFGKIEHVLNDSFVIEKVRACPACLCSYRRLKIGVGIIDRNQFNARKYDRQEEQKR